MLTTQKDEEARKENNIPGQIMKELLCDRDVIGALVGSSQIICDRRQRGRESGRGSLQEASASHPRPGRPLLGAASITLVSHAPW